MSLAAAAVVLGTDGRRELRVTSLEFWGNICLVRSARQRLRQRPESQGRNPRPPRHGEFDLISVLRCTKSWALGCEEILPSPACLPLSKTGSPFSPSL